MEDSGDASSSLSINVQELEKFMKISLQTFGKRPKMEEPCTIYKVLGTVRKEHKEDYTPKIIAIGPFHRDDVSLKNMEPLKWRYLQQLIRRNMEKNTLQNYINTIGEAVTEARSYYSEQVKLDDDEFVGMMVLDGGFLIEYLVKAYTGELEHLGMVNWNRSRFRSDLLLLENQFPFPILQRLFDSSDIPVLLDLKMDGSPVTLMELAVTYVTRNKIESLPESSRPETIHHLLHVYHASIHPTPQRENQIARACCGYATVSTMKSLASAPFLWLLSTFLNCCGSCRRSSKEKNFREPRGIQTATQLRISGVQFRNKKNAGSFLDVRFNKEAGMMEIPMLSIQEATISQFRNLIAFEQCCPEAGSHFTSHATLMNTLIDTPMDVAILKDAHIIESKLGEDKVVELFNNLCKGAYLDFEKHHYNQLFKDVVAYSNIDRHKWRAGLMQDYFKWRAGLMHDYFSNPWAMISLVAAIFLLSLTVVQTTYAVYAYYRPPSSGN